MTYPSIAAIAMWTAFASSVPTSTTAKCSSSSPARFRWSPSTTFSTTGRASNPKTGRASRRSPGTFSRWGKKIAFVYGAEDTVSDIRLTTFPRTMNEAGSPFRMITSSPLRITIPPPREATAQLLALADRPTCILMPDDYSALGGMDAIRAAGLRIPEDISITGYDGVAMIQMCQPQLTTVEQDVSRIGREAARKLVHLIEQPRTTLPEIISVPCRLIAGKTVAKLG